MRKKKAESVTPNALGSSGSTRSMHSLLKPALGNHGLWLALTLFMVARGVTLTLYAPKYIRVR